MTSPKFETIRIKIDKARLIIKLCIFETWPHFVRYCVAIYEGSLCCIAQKLGPDYNFVKTQDMLEMNQFTFQCQSKCIWRCITWNECTVDCKNYLTPYRRYNYSEKGSEEPETVLNC